jgi:hypothetical protein
MRVFSTSIEASFSQTRRSPASRSRPEILRHNPAQSGYAIFRHNPVTPYSGTIGKRYIIRNTPIASESGTIRLRHIPVPSGFSIIRNTPPQSVYTSHSPGFTIHNPVPSSTMTIRLFAHFFCFNPFMIPSDYIVIVLFKFARKDISFSCKKKVFVLAFLTFS